MDNVDWNELVDLYVDGELSTEEAARVEDRAGSDPAIRDQINWAFSIRKTMRMLKSEPPEEMTATILAEVDKALAWDVVRAADRPPRSNAALRWRVGMAAVAGCAAALTGIVATVWFGGTDGSARPEQNVAVVDEPERIDPVRVSVDSELVEPTRIMTPSSEGGETSVTTGPLRSQSLLWVSVKFASEDELDHTLQIFKRRCAKLDIDYRKSNGDDRRLTLQRVTSTQWRELADWFEANGCESDFSEALEKLISPERVWDAEQTIATDLGVFFDLVKSKDVPLDTGEEQE